MTDERSKEMRDLLFSLPPALEVRDNMKDAMRDLSAQVDRIHKALKSIQ